jgi:hypothetical protein
MCVCISKRTLMYINPYFCEQTIMCSKMIHFYTENLILTYILFLPTFKKKKKEIGHELSALSLIKILKTENPVKLIILLSWCANCVSFVHERFKSHHLYTRIVEIICKSS